MAEDPVAPVTFFTNIPNPHNGYLYRSLRAEGSAAQTIYRGDPASAGRPWQVVPDPPDRIASSLWDERRELTARRPDRATVVLCGSWATPRDAARRLATAATKRSTRIVVWGERMSDSSGLRGAARRVYYSSAGLDAVLAIGSWARGSFRAATGGRLPVHVFPYSTDDGLDVPRARASRPVVGFCGRLIELKGPDVLVRALGAMAPADRPDLEIVGSGPLDRQLADLSAHLGVTTTFHGEVDSARLAEIRSRWWLSLAPSQLMDGWGLVVPEALNSGVPVIASGMVGASHDLLRDGLDGWVVPVDRVSDPAAWADAISLALASDGAELSTNAREVGVAFSAAPAARWLLDLLAGDLDQERSFVDEAWLGLGAATPRTTDAG